MKQWYAESESGLRRGEKMILPTPDQTASLWLLRAWDQKCCYVQDVFAGDSSIERAHRNNCRLLIKRNYLRPEVDDGVKPYRRSWDMTIRYHLNLASLRLPTEISQTSSASSYRSEALNAVHIG